MRVVRFLVMAGVLFVAFMLAAGPAAAIDVQLCDRKASIMGYINQSMGFGIAGNHYDTQPGFQQATFQMLVETRLDWSNDLRFFGSVGLNADWAYLIREDHESWDDKDFDNSKDRLFMFDDFKDILHELHATWTPSDWFVRFGKQIVVWGETDGFRLMDQINPADGRRGLTDVEFETTILPIYLLRVEHYFHPESEWLTDLGMQFIFNPNFEFRGDEYIRTGNDESGIWAPRVDINMGPMGTAHLGSQNAIIDRPRSFMDHNGYEYGFRLTSVIWDSIVTLNAFDGRDNLPATKGRPVPPTFTVAEWDKNLVLHPAVEGYYPRQRFVGFTFSRDFEKLYISALGGIAPVVRMEAFYAFNNTYTANPNSPFESFEKFDEYRVALGVDWKIKIRPLNARDSFMVSPQVYRRTIRDYPGGTSAGLTQNGQIVRDDNYQGSLMINTTYFHNKVVPMVFWLRDFSEKSNWIKAQVGYERSDVWNYTLGVVLFNGAKTADGFQVFHNKDQLFFTVGYRFS